MDLVPSMAVPAAAAVPALSGMEGGEAFVVLLAGMLGEVASQAEPGTTPIPISAPASAGPAAWPGQAADAVAAAAVPAPDLPGEAILLPEGVPPVSTLPDAPALLPTEEADTRPEPEPAMADTTAGAPPVVPLPVSPAAPAPVPVTRPVALAEAKAAPARGGEAAGDASSRPALRPEAAVPPIPDAAPLAEIAAATPATSQEAAPGRAEPALSQPGSLQAGSPLRGADQDAPVSAPPSQAATQPALLSSALPASASAAPAVPATAGTIHQTPADQVASLRPPARVAAPSNGALAGRPGTAPAASIAKATSQEGAAEAMAAPPGPPSPTDAPTAAAELAQPVAPPGSGEAVSMPERRDLAGRPHEAAASVATPAPAGPVQADTRLPQPDSPVLGTTSQAAAPGEATPPPRSHAPIPLPARQVAPFVVALALGPDSSINLTLDPVELGRVEVAIERHGTEAHISLRAERPETLALLQRDRAELERALSSAGLSGADGRGASLSFGLGGGGEGQASRERRPSQGGGAPRDAMPLDPANTETTRAPSTARSLIDLAI